MSTRRHLKGDSLPDGTLLRLLEEHFREQGSWPYESARTPEAAARAAAQISKTLAAALKSGSERAIKAANRIESFDEAVGKFAVAEPGSREYRSLWAEVRRADPDCEFRPYVAAAIGLWADIALNETKEVADRFLAGSIAQFVLFHCRDTMGAASLGETTERARTRGAEVSAALLKLLAKHPRTPKGLFASGPTAKAIELGYRMFRIRMVGDAIGWMRPKTDAERTEVYVGAYDAGYASDSMWLYEVRGRCDLAFVYRAWQLASHKSDWALAAGYGIAMLKQFPRCLVNKIETIKPLLEDEETWPGLAAVLALRQFDVPESVRDVFENQASAHSAAISRIRAMRAGIIENSKYLTVLALGKQP